jgi:anti-sigma-K factor RskA
MTGDVHALSGAYAVDALDEAERIEFERHLATCETCRSEVDSLQEGAAALAALVEISPPDRLREAVLTQAATVRPLPPLLVHHLPRRRAARWSRPLVAAAAALVLVAGAGAGVLTWQPWHHSASIVADTSPQQVIQAPDVQTVTQTLPGGAMVTLYRSVALDRAVVVTHDMPSAPGGHVYELWLQDAAGTMHPGGLMPPASDATVLVGGPAAGASGLGITVEPAGGSAAPTTAPIALLGLPA